MEVTTEKGRASQTKPKIKNQGERIRHQNQSGKDRKKGEDQLWGNGKVVTKFVGWFRSIVWGSPESC